ncbi:hypothetical protein ACQCSV_13475 [Pseudarthrobacter sp. S3]|uniref:hypothetical protein n=1 Tax=Pseudarthrobacter sp. S3 TaxID=3418419 RepID=UPI003CF13445
MKKLSQKLKVRATGLTPAQSDMTKHFKKNPDGATYPVRVIDATTFLKMVVMFIASLIRPELDKTYRATFMNVGNWNDCVQWQGATTLDGSAPTSVCRRIARFFGLDVPNGARIAHICQETKDCAAESKCSHRACVNLTRWHVTTPSGCISRSNNAKLGEAGKFPSTCGAGPIASTDMTQFPARSTRPATRFIRLRAGLTQRLVWQFAKKLSTRVNSFRS